MRPILLSLVCFLSLAACTGKSPSTETGQSGHSHPATGDSAHATTLQTDQGKKWKADTATLQGIRKMAATAAAASAGSLKGQPLTDSLSADFAAIFAKCTMKGTAHDQLHLFLQPLKAQLDALKAGGDETRLVAEMQQHLASFDQYFE